MVEILLEDGWQVRATDLPSALEKDDRRRGRFPSVIRRKGVEVVPSDLTKKESLRGLAKGVDTIFHIAAVFDYSAPLDLLRRVNVDGTRNLLETIVENGSVRRLLNWGAGGAYGYAVKSGVPIRENDPKEPSNNYLQTKWDQEQLAHTFCRENGIECTSIRPTTVYGPRAVYGGGQFIMDPARMKTVSIPRNFTFRIPFIHVRDVCRSALFLATKKEAADQAYNTSDPNPMPTVDYFRFVADEMGHRFVTLPPVPVQILRRIGIVAANGMALWSKYVSHQRPKIERDTLEYLGIDFVYDVNKLQRLGFEFEYPDPKEGIRQTLAWYKEQGWI